MWMVQAVVQARHWLQRRPSQCRPWSSGWSRRCALCWTRGRETKPLTQHGPLQICARWLRASLALPRQCAVGSLGELSGCWRRHAACCRRLWSRHVDALKSLISQAAVYDGDGEEEQHVESPSLRPSMASRGLCLAAYCLPRCGGTREPSSLLSDAGGLPRARQKGAASPLSTRRGAAGSTGCRGRLPRLSRTWEASSVTAWCAPRTAPATRPASQPAAINRPPASLPYSPRRAIAVLSPTIPDAFGSRGAPSSLPHAVRRAAPPVAGAQRARPRRPWTDAVRGLVPIPLRKAAAGGATPARIL